VDLRFRSITTANFNHIGVRSFVLSGAPATEPERAIICVDLQGMRKIAAKIDAYMMLGLL
jgi:hypothetical protein